MNVGFYCSWDNFVRLNEKIGLIGASSIFSFFFFFPPSRGGGCEEGNLKAK